MSMVVPVGDDEPEDDDESPDEAAGTTGLPAPLEGMSEELRDAFAFAIKRLRDKTDGDPEEIAEAFSDVFAARIISKKYSGPYPSPEMLAAYDDRFPGLGMMLIERTNKEQDFRHEMGRAETIHDNAVLNHIAKKTYLGQIGAFIIAMTCIVGGLILIWNDKGAAGLTSIIFALSSLLVAFLTGQLKGSNSSSDEEDDADEMSAED
jgi:uncharacterized membrane protein